MHLICSRETRLPFSPLHLPSTCISSSRVLCEPCDVYSLSIKCILYDGELTSLSKNCQRCAVCKLRMYFSRTSYVFYRFRRRFPARILRSYQQSNHRTREGRHFYVSGETSRRLQSKLYEKRERASVMSVTLA